MFERIRNAIGRWRRGDRRIAPRGVRGRVYRNPADDAPSGVKIPVDAKMNLSAKVTRADGTIEDYQIMPDGTVKLKEASNDG